MENGRDGAPALAARGETANVIDLAHLLEERNTFERRLLQVQKLEAIGQLAGGVTHDLNNLIAIVAGQLDQVEKQLAGHPEVHEHVTRCRRAVERTAALIRSMLAFLREQELHPEPFDLRPAVDGFLDLLRHAVGRNIRIQVDHARALWPCRADRTQLLNALLNLAVNARDAMAGGGTLLISTRNARVGAGESAAAAGLAPGEYVVLLVTDTGAGMTRDVLARACDPFFTTKTGGRGSGLGLSMVHGFVRRSGGAMTIDSELGQGTTVRLYLPRAQAAAPAHDGAAPPAGPAAGEPDAVLVIDDDEDFRDMLVTMLHGLGYRPVPARSAAEALGILRGRADIAVILLDQGLAENPGAAPLTDRIATERPQPRIVRMSGHARQTLIGQGRLDPAASLLEKPFGTQELLSAIGARCRD